MANIAVVALLVVYLGFASSSNQYDKPENITTSARHTGHTVAAIESESNSTQSCFTVWKKLEKGHVVRYYNSNCSNKVDVLRCYCLTADTSSTTTAVTHYGIGHCMYSCFKTNYLGTEYNTIHFDDLQKGVCANFSREGLLCGRCIANHSPAVYSFTLRCVECMNVSLWKRTLLYIIVAYGPLTVFLFMIILFTVSVNSAPLYGLIFLCQYIACSNHMRVLTTLGENGSYPWYTYKILGTIYGIWNLDFFRSVYRPFCLHPSLNTLQVLALDYVIAAYPLIIIILLYILVELHSRDCRPIVTVWKPFYYCFARLRHNLNIRTSLVDAFGTFFTLSYVKILSVTSDLIFYTHVWSDRDTISKRMYSDGTVLFFRGTHIPFAIACILITVVCNLLPLGLIIIYSFPKMQKITQCFPISFQNALHPFMDNLLSCYKDGTNGTRNCRYFAIVYYISRILLFVAFISTKDKFYYPESLCVILVTVFLIVVIQPYKSTAYNTLDAGLMLTVALTNTSVLALITAEVEESIMASKVAGFATATTPVLCVLGYLSYKSCHSKRSLLTKGTWSLLVSLCRKIYAKTRPMRTAEMLTVSERVGLLN